MSSPRFFSDVPLTSNSSITLPATAANHAIKVLRLQVGDALRLFNGDGHDYSAEIETIRKNEVIVKTGQAIAVSNESRLKITLAQGISAGDRMDFTIQKSVELGIHAIQPISCQRSVVKLSGDRADKRREHWQNVAISACEQSGRAFLPEVGQATSLAKWLSSAPPFATRITLDPLASTRLQDLPLPQGPICLLIGPEGGLTSEEIAMAASQGFTGVQLGPRILRTETAALAALAAINTVWGDF
jgi:16S rRNA (uracil1498-N3)-methyltransferase